MDESADRGPAGFPDTRLPNLNLSDDMPAKAEPAGFWRRFGASVLDSLVVAVLSNILAAGIKVLMLAGVGGLKAQATSIAITTVFGWVVAFFYFGWFYSHKGASPGKLALNLRVVRAGNGVPLTYWRSFGREVPGKYLSALILLIGFLMAAFRQDKRALHDLLFDTQVLHVKS